MLFPAKTLLNTFFDDLYHETLDNYPVIKTRLLPLADVIQNEKDYEVQLAVPGFEKDDFKINVEDEKLVVSGERKETKNLLQKETFYGKFTRSFKLPKDAAVTEAEANYVNGLLVVKVPKVVNQSLAKQILVK